MLLTYNQIVYEKPQEIRIIANTNIAFFHVD